MKKLNFLILVWMAFSHVVVHTQTELKSGAGNVSEERPSLANVSQSYGTPIESGDWFSSQTTMDLPLGQFVSGQVSAAQMNIYAARYSTGTGGSMKLEVRALGEPAPTAAFPLTISVRNSAGGYTFTLPQPVPAAAEPAMSVSRVMCPSAVSEDACVVTVGAGGGGPGVSYGYEMRLSVLDADAWFLEEGAAPRAVNVTPSASAVFQYRWPDDPAVHAVRVSAASGDGGACAGETGACAADGADCDSGRAAAGDVGACALLTVQPAVCPLTLTVAEVLAAGRHLTFTACGTMVVRRDQYPGGFFAAVLLHADDDACYPDQARAAAGPRLKPVRVSVSPHQVQFAYAVVPVALAVAFVLIGSLGFSLRSHRARVAAKRRRAAEAAGDDSCAAAGPDCEDGGGGADSAAPGLMLQEEPPAAAAPRTPPILLSPASVVFTCALLIVAFGANSVAMDLAIERRTGNMDICYRNDLCRNDAGGVPDLNHVLSNLPYMGAGIGLLLAVAAQRLAYLEATQGGTVALGVPHDFDLFASMGVALMLEGITSGLYHFCPNSRNSLIDFFFIYYLYGVLGAKLFQTRRGVTARFHYTPALLVAAITLLGSLQFVAGRSYAWWATVVIVHMVASSVWAVYMYLHGDFGMFWPCRRRAGAVDRRTRRIALAHLVLNLTLGVIGLAAPSAFTDFTLYALLFFTLNSGLYTIFYLVMKKVRHHERPSYLSMTFLLVGLAFVVPALVVFVFYNPYNTEASAALSRTANAPCVNMGFFDAHDVWHFLSAGGLFFTLTGILTLDDDLLSTPRDKIPIF